MRDPSRQKEGHQGHLSPSQVRPADQRELIIHKQLRLTLNWIFFLFLISLKKCKEPREEHLRFSIKHLTGSQSCHIPPGTPQLIVSHLDWK